LQRFGQCNLLGKTYLCKELEVGGNQAVIGTHAAKYLGTVLKLPDGANTYIIANSSWVNSTTGSDNYWVVRNIWLDGNAANNPSSRGLAYFRGFRALVQNVVGGGCAGEGIVLDFRGKNNLTWATPLGGGTAAETHFDNVTVFATGKQGFFSRGKYAEISTLNADVYVRDMNLSNCGYLGYDSMLIERSAGWKISGCQIYQPGKSCMRILSPGRTIVTGNHCDVENPTAVVSGDIIGGIVIGSETGLTNISNIVLSNNTVNMNDIPIVSGATYAGIAFIANNLLWGVSVGGNSINDLNGVGSPLQKFYFSGGNGSGGGARFFGNSGSALIAAGHEPPPEFTFDMG
jgi:hypothetical protein